MVGPNRGDLNDWLLWPGVTIMVVSSLVSFCFSMPAVLRSFRRTNNNGDGNTTNQDTGEVSKQWFIFSIIIALVLGVALQTWLFDIKWWAAVCAVLLSFLLAIVACRVSGETNVTPVGAMGKVTQLVFAGLMPSNAAANLTSASVTAGAASQAADLMHDLKCGHLLGAIARKQVVGQIFGCIAGSIVGCMFYMILIPNPREMLLTDEWPAPAVAQWKAVAELFMRGFDSLPPGVTTAMMIACVVAIVLPVLDRLAPKKAKMWIPSAAALGLAFVIPASNSVSMFIGATLALLITKMFPRWSDRFLITLCAGIVAGESLTGAGDAVRLILMK
jgi:OPT family oligopeptide transporter